MPELIQSALSDCLRDIGARFSYDADQLIHHARNAPYADNRPDGSAYPGATGTPDERRLWYALVRTIQPVAIVECGVNWGVSTIQFLSAIRDNQSGKLVSVDIREHIEGHRPVGSLIPKHLRNNFRLMAGWSAGDYLKWHHEAIDFFFEDTDHTYDTTKLIYETVQERLTSGALCVSHDPISTPPVVKGMTDAGCEPTIYHINKEGTGIALWQTP